MFQNKVLMDKKKIKLYKCKIVYFDNCSESILKLRFLALKFLRMHHQCNKTQLIN